MNEELRKLLIEIKEKIIDIIPHTLLGYFILISINGLSLHINSTDFLVNVGATGVYVFCLGIAYYLGRAILLFVNLSRKNGGERK